MIRNIITALGAGFVGGLANVIAVWSFGYFQGIHTYDHTFIYKQAFWGGMWAILFCLPFLKEKWVVRGLVVSTLTTLSAFFVFQSLPLTPINVLKGITVNLIVWGNVASYLYHRYHVRTVL